MAYAAIKHSPSPESVFCEDDEDHNSIIMQIEKATDHFIFKEFQSCIDVCCQGINRTKIFPDCSRCLQATVSLTVLAIQAYAEMNQWDLVLPFVQNVYGDVVSCPSRVIQLCLLLHAKVKQFIQCHAMAKVWLQHNANRGVCGYTDVAKLYVLQILIPLGAYNLIPQFVEGCSELTFEEKQNLLSPVKSSKSEVFGFEESSAADSSDESFKHTEPVHPKQTKGNYFSFRKQFEVVQRLFCTIQNILSRFKESSIWKLLAMLTLGTMAIIHTQFGDPFCGFSRAIKVWEAVIQVWYRVCGT